MKVRVAAPSTVAAILLSLSTYGVHLDAAIHRLIAEVVGEHANFNPGSAPALADYESDLQPFYMALDSTLSSDAAASADAPMRLTLAVPDGETLAGVLATAEIPADDARAAVEAARKVYDPRHLRAGQFITVNFAGAGGPFQGFELQADADHLVSIVRGKDGFQAQQDRIVMRTETKAARGVIKNSLFDSAAEAGIPNIVAAAMIHAFQYDVDFQRDIQPGDRFEVMYDTMIGDSGNRPGDLLFAKLTLSGKQHEIYGFRRDDGTVDFFTRDGKNVRKALLRTPVDGARLSSGFGMRLHPILGFTRMHKGVDFAVPTGTPVYAAGDGVVEVSGWAGGYGRYIRIKHGANMATAYAHLSRIAGSSAVGQHVHQGQIIGYSGMTGMATGPHLHYEVLKNGAQVNPISVSLPVNNTALEGQELVAFEQKIAERDQRFAALLTGVQFAAVHAP